MSFESDLVSFLLADADVKALIGDRLFPGMAPERETQNHATYEKISANTWNHLEGATSTVVAKYRIDCYTIDPDTDPDEIATAIRQSDGGISGGKQLQSFAGAMGSTTIRCCRCEDWSDTTEGPPSAMETPWRNTSLELTVTYVE